MTQAERQQAKDPRFVEKTKLVRSGRRTLQKPEGWVFRVLQMIPGARHYTFRLDGPFREFADHPWGGGGVLIRWDFPPLRGRLKINYFNPLLPILQ